MELRKSYFADQRKDGLHEIGQPRPRLDSPGHVTGKTAYFADRFESIAAPESPPSGSGLAVQGAAPNPPTPPSKP